LAFLISSNVCHWLLTETACRLEGLAPKLKITAFRTLKRTTERILWTKNIIKAVKKFDFDFFSHKAEICNYETVSENIETTVFILQAIHKISNS
jgi:hypothetical protein